MNPLVSRRQFLGRASAGAGLLILSGRRGFGKISPNEKLNLGVIGVAGRGGDDLAEVSSENIVALCDIDEHNLAAAAKKYNGAQNEKGDPARHADSRRRQLSACGGVGEKRCDRQDRGGACVGEFQLRRQGAPDWHGPRAAAYPLRSVAGSGAGASL